MTDKELMTEIELRSDDEVSTLVEGSRGLKRYRDRFNQQALDTYRERHQGEEPEPDPMKDRETFEKEKKNWHPFVIIYDPSHLHSYTCHKIALKHP